MFDARGPTRWALVCVLASAVTAATATADVFFPLPARLALVSVSTESRTSPDDEAERIRRHVHSMLRADRGLRACLRPLSFTRNAGTMSVLLTYDRSAEARIEIRSTGQLPAEASQCAEASAGAVRLFARTSAMVVVRASFRVVEDFGGHGY